MDYKRSVLVDAHILIVCSDEKHKSCDKLKYALLDNYNDIKVAYNIRPTFGGEPYCIAATAKIDGEKYVEAFRSSLKKFKVKGKNLGVKNVRIDLEQKAMAVA